jgi:hypothetical protein
VLVLAAPVVFGTAAMLGAEQQNTVYNKQKQKNFQLLKQTSLLDKYSYGASTIKRTACCLTGIYFP